MGFIGLHGVGLRVCSFGRWVEACGASELLGLSSQGPGTHPELRKRCHHGPRWLIGIILELIMVSSFKLWEKHSI